MKFSLIRPAALLAMALGLASCGGGGDDDSFTVGGTIKGLEYPNLVLTNNGGDNINVAPPAKAGDVVTYTFPKKLEYGDTYKVAVLTQPAHQTCGVDPDYPLSDADTAGRLGAINARFACSINAYAIGGKVNGLTKDNTGLVLANGSTTGSVEIAPTSTDATAVSFDYAMPLKVQYNQTYSVTIVTQPTGRFCTVENPAGTMGDAPVTNININCVPR